MFNLTRLTNVNNYTIYNVVSWFVLRIFLNLKYEA